MKSATKKLLISIMILAVAVSLAATSTYAWFTMNNEPELNGFDVNVTTQDGLYISLTPATDTDPSLATAGLAGTFKSYVTKDEITAAILAYNNGQFATEGELKALSHATTANGNTFTVPAGIDTVAGDTTHYTFRLYFYSNNEYQVALKASESAVTSVAGTTPDVAAWKEIVLNSKTAGFYAHKNNADTDDKNIATGSAIAVDAKDTVRISFHQGTSATLGVWDPNATEGYTNNTTGNIALDYYNWVNGTTVAAGTIYATDSISTDTQVLTTLTGTTDAGYNGYMDISLWLEGWDANCFNSILADTITTALKFIGTVVAQ